jgi:hypothetical protein
MRRYAGSAGVDWIAAVTMVAALMAGLLVLGSHRVSRRPPVDPVRALGLLVTPPARVVAPPVIIRPPRRRTVPTHPRKTRHPRPLAEAPGWVWR